jgi:hypothetical protein
MSNSVLQQAGFDVVTDRSDELKSQYAGMNPIPITLPLSCPRRFRKRGVLLFLWKTATEWQFSLTSLCHACGTALRWEQQIPKIDKLQHRHLGYNIGGDQVASQTARFIRTPVSHPQKVVPNYDFQHDISINSSRLSYNHSFFWYHCGTTQYIHLVSVVDSLG